MKTPVWIFLLAAIALPASAANFSGKWAIQNAAGRGGRGGPTILTLNQVGNEVTGTVSQRMNQGSGSPVGQEIMDGKVDGDTLTFYVWVGGDEPVKQTYKGTMSGDEITLTVSGGRGGGGMGGFGGGQAGGRGGATAGQPGAPAQPAATGQNATAGRGANASGPQPVVAKRTK